MATVAPGLYIGVDGGGTSTTAVVLSSTGAVLGQASSGSTNFNSVGRDKAKDHLHAAIQLAVNTVPDATLASVMSICMGISGCNTDADAAMFISWVRELYSPSSSSPPFVSSYNDSIAALASGTAGRLHGLVVIAGTGQMAKGLNQRNRGHPSLPLEWTCGGNGGLVDDGSGFGIALDTLRAAFQAADGMGPSTPMLQDVLAHVGGSKAEDIVPWMYDTFSWGHVATVAPIAFRHAGGQEGGAGGGDPVARRIVEKHAGYLVRAALTLVEKLGFGEDEEVPVVLCGGILEQPLMAELVGREVRKALPKARIGHPQVDPAHGAALLAITQAEKRGSGIDGAAV